MIIAVDFDGTCVDHRYPDVGADVPHAADWLRRFVAAGAKLILWTMRSDESKLCAGFPNTLKDAEAWFERHGIPLFGANDNPQQHSWTASRKAFAHLYVDDAGFGCPLLPNPRQGGRPYVDWSIVGPGVLKIIQDQRK